MVLELGLQRALLVEGARVAALHLGAGLDASYPSRGAGADVVGAAALAGAGHGAPERGSRRPRAHGLAPLPQRGQVADRKGAAPPSRHLLLRFVSEQASASLTRLRRAQIAAYLGVLGGATGSQDNAEVLQVRAEQFYEAATRGGQTALSARRLVEYCHELGLMGEHDETDMAALFATFDTDHDDSWSFDEFLVQPPELWPAAPPCACIAGRAVCVCESATCWWG